MDIKKQTLSEFIFKDCSESLLYELSTSSDYWNKVDKFIVDNANTPLEKLTLKQREWAVKIKDGLIEEARKP